MYASHSVYVADSCPNFYTNAYFANDLGTRYVVQAMADGIGCVIDVGWSTFMEQVVVRIAVGPETPLEPLLAKVEIAMDTGRGDDLANVLKQPALTNLHQAVSGNIVLRKTVGSDYELPLALVTAIQALKPAGQIYRKSLLPNSKHGIPGVFWSTFAQRACANAVQRGGVMASDLDYKQYADLLERAKRKPSLIIQIISDGLVGEVRTLT